MSGTHSARSQEPSVSIETAVKLSFFSGLIGSLLVGPVVYVAETLLTGSGFQATYVPLGVFMLFAGSAITGTATAVLALISYPVIRAACRRGLISI